MQEVFSLRKPYEAPKMVHPVYCDCCGTVKLAKRDGDKLVIKDRQHGKVHVAVVPLDSKEDTSKLKVDT